MRNLPAFPKTATALLVTAVLSVAVALSGCPTDPNTGPPPCEDDFCLDKPPTINIEPSSRVLTILESEVAIGESVDRPIRVLNSGESALLVQKVTLQYTPPAGATDGDTPALTLVDPVFSMPATVHPIGSDQFPQGADFYVRFTRPSDGISREATLVIESNDPFARTVNVTVKTESGAPELIPQPPAMDFGLVTKGETAADDISLLNAGSRTLSVSGFRINDVRFKVEGPGFSIGGSADAPTEVDLTEAIVVPVGESRPITVTFISDSPSPADATLTVFSDDPDAVDGTPINLTANKSGPCILVNPRSVKFGGKAIGGAYTQEVDITSCGTDALVIEGINLSPESSPDFVLGYTTLPGAPETSPTKQEPLLVDVNNTVTVEVTYVPDEVNPKDADNQAIPDDGTIVINTNAFESRVEVEVTGAGAESECPVAVIHVEEGEEVIPQTVLHLDGTQSYAPFGAITNYAWTLEGPDGNVETFVPNATDPQPILAANVVGAYTFRLRVRDAAGKWSDSDDCANNAEYTVLVQPSVAIHVELTWVTPGDPDETDVGEAVGTDLDLHFTHPSATGPDLDGDSLPDPWFDESYDCFWHNNSPNWASFDPGANDDPSLDRDDTDGAGPENLNLAVPEVQTYRVAVHYWEAHDYGEAIATLRIYSFAELKYEVTDITLQERDMWCVANATWLGDDLEVTNCSGMDGVQNITPGYVNPFFFSP